MSKSAERSFEILKEIVKSDDPMGLMELANKLNFDKSTTSRLLRTLEKHQFVSRDSKSRAYTIGVGLLALATAVSKRSTLLHVVRPYLERLRDLSNETVTFYLRVGDGRVCVDGIESKLGFFRVLPLGVAVPLYEGTSAKVILAFLPEEEAEAILFRSKLSEEDKIHIRKQLAIIRQNSFFAAIGERVSNTASISVPVHDSSGVFGAITISGPPDRWTVDDMKTFAPTLMSVAQDISTLLKGSNLRLYGSL